MPSEWRNWAGDQRCTPAAIERPGTRGELTDAIGRAAAQQRAVRAAASGHSFTDIACTAGVMLRLERLDRVLDVDRESGLVRVEAGIGLHDLAQALDPHGVRAARAGLGALGMIYAVTLRTVPAFTIRRVDRPAPLQETLAGLDELPDLHDHFELYTFPHTDVAVLRQSERTDEPPRPRSRRREYVQEVVLENWVAEAYARVSRRLPSLTGPLARALAGRIGRSVKVDRSHRVFASERRLRFTEMEYANPREHGAEAVRRVLELIEREDLRVSLPIEVRFVAPDDAFLSPSHERETCYVAVHMYRGVAWERYFRGVEQIMDSYGGRPHWGKRHFQTAETLAPRYPRWADFQRVRARLDPHGRFANPYIDRVLGPAGGGAGPG